MIGWGFMSQANIPVPGLPLYYASVESLANRPTDQLILPLVPMSPCPRVPYSIIHPSSFIPHLHLYLRS